MTCDHPAMAVLTFSPQEAKAWLYDLEMTDTSHGIILCRRHANATVVPMSWQLIDARDPAWPGPAGMTDDNTHADVASDPDRAFTEAVGVAAIAAAPVEPAAPSLPAAADAPSTAVTVPNLVTPNLVTPNLVTPNLVTLPSDSINTNEFAALRAELPVATQPYAEPQAATLRAAGVVVHREASTEADMSLFQLPLADTPAVTPHPEYR